MEFIVAAYTDAGIQKSSNQDSLCIRRAVLTEGGEMLMAVVCDGMGGLQKGEVASAEVIRAFGNWFDSNLQSLPQMCAAGFDPVKAHWGKLIGELHQRLLNYAQDQRIQLGTTLAAFFSFRDRYVIVNVGDSRVYENKRTMTQLTEDQSLVAQEVARGRITPEQASHHPQRNMLLQCIGTGSSVNPVFMEGTVLSDAAYLLCTDGFVHELTTAELFEQLQPVYLGDKEALTEALTRLTETCKQRGETDNITAVLIKTRETACVGKKRFDWKKLLKKKINDVAECGASLVETAQIIYSAEQIE